MQKYHRLVVFEILAPLVSCCICCELAKVDIKRSCVAISLLLDQLIKYVYILLLAVSMTLAVMSPRFGNCLPLGFPYDSQVNLQWTVFNEILILLLLLLFPSLIFRCPHGDSTSPEVMVVDMRLCHCAVVMTDIWWSPLNRLLAH